MNDHRWEAILKDREPKPPVPPTQERSILPPWIANIPDAALLAAMVTASAAYLAWATYLMSSPFIEIFTGIFALFALIGLVAFWVVLLILVGIRRGWKVHSKRRLLLNVLALVPLLVVLAILAVFLVYKIPLNYRFDQSESDPLELTQRYNTSGQNWLFPDGFYGLYRVNSVHRIAGCVLLETGAGIDDHGGFAYCDGDLPIGTNVNFEHLRDNWWTYNHFNGPACIAEPCSLSGND